MSIGPSRRPPDHRARRSRTDVHMCSWTSLLTRRRSKRRFERRSPPRAHASMHLESSRREVVRLEADPPGLEMTVERDEAEVRRRDLDGAYRPVPRPGHTDRTPSGQRAAVAARRVRGRRRGMLAALPAAWRRAHRGKTLRRHDRFSPPRRRTAQRPPPAAVARERRAVHRAVDPREDRRPGRARQRRAPSAARCSSGCGRRRSGSSATRWAAGNAAGAGGEPARRAHLYRVPACLADCPR
jgi:hypothetical protein